ncbi:hypothetical protein ACFE04_003245 [Oxalis oulophora]
MTSLWRNYGQVLANKGKFVEHFNDKFEDKFDTEFNYAIIQAKSSSNLNYFDEHDDDYIVLSTLSIEGGGCKTRVTKWNQCYQYTLKSRELSQMTFFLEVIHMKSKTELGTSNGMAVVGRARIPIGAEPPSNIRLRVPLVRMSNGACVTDGEATVCMEFRCKPTY